MSLEGDSDVNRCYEAEGEDVSQRGRSETTLKRQTFAVCAVGSTLSPSNQIPLALYLLLDKSIERPSTYMSFTCLQLTSRWLRYIIEYMKGSWIY